MKQVLCLAVGQSGIAIADACWNAFRLEHNLSVHGEPMGDRCSQDDIPMTNFFSLTGSERYVPRTVFVDTNRNSFDSIVNSQCLYDPASFIESTLQRSEQSVALEAIRHFADDCDNLEGFIIFNSLSGRAGSHVTANLLELLSN